MVNDTGDVAGAAVLGAVAGTAAARASALTAAERKAAEEQAEAEHKAREEKAEAERKAAEEKAEAERKAKEAAAAAGPAQEKPKPKPKEKTEETIDPDSMFKDGFLKEVYNLRPEKDVISRFPPEPNVSLPITRTLWKRSNGGTYTGISPHWPCKGHRRQLWLCPIPRRKVLPPIR